MYLPEEEQWEHAYNGCRKNWEIHFSQFSEIQNTHYIVTTICIQTHAAHNTKKMNDTTFSMPTRSLLRKVERHLPIPFCKDPSVLTYQLGKQIFRYQIKNCFIFEEPFYFQWFRVFSNLIILNFFKDVAELMCLGLESYLVLHGKRPHKLNRTSTCFKHTCAHGFVVSKLPWEFYIWRQNVLGNKHRNMYAAM